MASLRSALRLTPRAQYLRLTPTSRAFTTIPRRSKQIIRAATDQKPADQAEEASEDMSDMDDPNMVCLIISARARARGGRHACTEEDNYIAAKILICFHTEWQLPRPLPHLRPAHQAPAPRPLRRLVSSTLHLHTEQTNVLIYIVEGGTPSNAATTANPYTKTTTSSASSLRKTTRTSRPLGEACLWYVQSYSSHSSLPETSLLTPVAGLFRSHSRRPLRCRICLLPRYSKYPHPQTR